MMKTLFIVLAAGILTASVWAQSPQKMSYQAVIRNADNNLVTNQSVGIRISILQGSVTGTEVYKEIFNPNPQTNANGLVTIDIGSGIVITGTFASINWANGPYFIKTETDPTGGTNYTIVGTSQLLSVPYAFHSKTAETLSGGITETDPVFAASPTKEITLTNITNWNSAYGWGNHAGLYRPISYVPAWNEVSSKPTFATVATSGSFNDLNDKPTTDGSETKLTAGTNITLTGNGTSASPYVINTVVSNMTTIEKNAISNPEKGLLVFDITLNQLCYWSGSIWECLTNSSCPPGFINCSGRCVSIYTDPNNCGACSTPCGPGYSCVNGTCVIICPAGQTNCGGSCVELKNDVSNCSACGTVCPLGKTCRNGICQ
jgi:hypothetical protein